jgi:hypothetical protein
MEFMIIIFAATVERISATALGPCLIIHLTGELAKTVRAAAPIVVASAETT